MSDKIIDINAEKNLKAIESSTEHLLELQQILGGDKAGFNTIAAVLALNDEDFSIVSENVILELEKNLNNPQERIVLVQTLNSQGMYSEDMVEIFKNLLEQTEALPDLSQGRKDFLKRIFSTIMNAIQETEGIAKRIISIPVEICREGINLPSYARNGDAGMDVEAAEETVINPGETKIVPTGIKCAIPLGYELQVRPRSGLSAKTNLRVANAPGTIDSGYRGEIGIIITNAAPKIKDSIPGMTPLYNASYTIPKGMKIAQLVLQEVPTCRWLPVDSVSEIGEDRGGGFGHTGV